MAFTRVARLEQIPEGRGKRVRVGEIEVGLFRVGNEVHAIENLCPHAGYPLSEGILEDCVVICPLHGWDFDVTTGFKPDDPDGFPIPCFAVRVEDGEISVDIEDQINRPRPGRR